MQANERDFRTFRTLRRPQESAAPRRIATALRAALGVLAAVVVALSASPASAYDGETEVLLDGDQAFIVPRGGTIEDAILLPPKDGAGGGLRAAARTIEVAVVVDLQFQALYGADWEGKVCELMAEARARLAEMDSIDVDLAHVHTTTLQATAPEPVASTTDPVTLLTQFGNWVEGPLPSYDTLLLLSGRDLDGSVVGFAFTGQTCTLNGDAIVEARKTVAFDGSTIAHELGHSMGLCHDPPASRSGSLCADLSAIVDPPTTCAGFIMEAASSVANPRTEFSQCSGEDFDNAILGGVGTCLNNVPTGALDEACLAVPPSSTLCTTVPREDCLAAGKSILQYKLGNEPAKNKMKWVWAKGGASDLGDLGDPLTLTTYEVCQYDGLDGGTTWEDLATALPVGAAWKATGTKGFAYKDKDALVGGVQAVKVKTGEAGKSKVLVKAKGADVPYPTGGAMSMVVQDPSVRIQLVNVHRCWDSTFVPADVKKDEADQFKAVVK